MITANISAQAKVNYGPHEWINVSGTSQFWNSYQTAPEIESWVYRPIVHVGEHGADIVIAVADRVANIPGVDPAWTKEILIDGTPGTRPCGIVMTYAFARQDIVRHGLPHRDQVQAAFKEDALQILAETYRTHLPVKMQPRTFTERPHPHDPEWQRMEVAFRKVGGVPFGREAASTVESKKNTADRGQRQKPLETAVWVVAGGLMAILGLLIWLR